METGLKGILMKNDLYRKEYLSRSLYRYCRRYFKQYYTFDTPKYILPVYRALQEGKNIFFEAFRNSAKTTLTQMYVNNVVARRTKRHIMRYSDTGDSSGENLMYIANSFIENDRFIMDYGNLYYDEEPTKKKSKTVKSKSKYITENEILLVAMSLGKSPRGKNYTASDGKYRPDLIVGDDIDTVKSVRNKNIIEKNWNFLLNETFGGTTANTQFIFLGNTIYEDGLVPRLAKHFSGKEDRCIFRQPIYDQDGKIVWNRFVETNEEAEERNQGILNPHFKIISLEKERERLGSISFGQNYLLEPYKLGGRIFGAHLIKYANCDGMYFERINIGIDTAISKKQESDNVAMTIVGFIGDMIYVIGGIILQGMDKRMPNQISVAKQLYGLRGSRCSAIRLHVESVAYQEVLCDYLKEENMAVIPIKTHKDKTTRAIEKQGLFESGKVIFNTTGCSSLIDNITYFPNVEKDDEMDSFMLALEDNGREIYV